MEQSSSKEAAIAAGGITDQLALIQEIKTIIGRVLDNIGFTKRADEGTVIRFIFGDATQTITTKIHLDQTNMILIYSWPEFFIPVQCRRKTMEYLNRKNFQSKIGSLEMDMSTGELRYRTSVNYNGATCVEGIVTTFIAMHRSYFAQQIYPFLLKLRNPDDTTSMDALVS